MSGLSGEVLLQMLDQEVSLFTEHCQIVVDVHQVTERVRLRCHQLSQALDEAILVLEVDE